jgi:Phosphotransferase enzyme family
MRDSRPGEHHGVMDRALLEATVDRAAVNDDGRSGAVLERVFLADGSSVVVKRFDPTVDMVMRLSGDPTGREVELVQRGVLDGLPPTVLHPVIDAWYDDDGRGVLVMRDLGDAVLTWKSIVSRDQARTMFAAAADLHAAYLCSTPDGLTSLDVLVGLFEPRRLRPYVGETIVDYALRGWEYWPEVAPGEVGEAVLALAHDTARLAAACRALPATLLHGDLATVNMAFEVDRPECLTLFDWGLAAAGPAELDIGRLLAGCAHLFGPVGRDGSAPILERLDGLVALQREVAGPSYDDDAMRVGLLSGLCWLGWNKALDIVEHPDPAVRERERAALPWWLRQAELALGTGLL